MKEAEVALAKACWAETERSAAQEGLYKGEKVGGAVGAEAYALKHVVDHASQGGLREVVEDAWTLFPVLYARVTRVPVGVVGLVEEGASLGANWGEAVRISSQALALSNTGGTLKERPRELAG